VGTFLRHSVDFFCIGGATWRMSRKINDSRFYVIVWLGGGTSSTEPF